MYEALAHNQRAREVEPLSIVLHHHAAWLSWLACRYDDAVESSRKTLELDASFGWAYLWMGLALEQQPSSGDAVESFRKAVELTGGFVQAVAALGHSLGRCGRRDEARDILRQIEQPSPGRYVDPYAVAIVYVGLGELDQALQSLETAANEVATWLTLFVKCDPRCEPLRSTPRYIDLLRRMRLAP